MKITIVKGMHFHAYLARNELKYYADLIKNDLLLYLEEVTKKRVFIHSYKCVATEDAFEVVFEFPEVYELETKTK